MIYLIFFRICLPHIIYTPHTNRESCHSMEAIYLEQIIFDCGYKDDMERVFEWMFARDYSIERHKLTRAGWVFPQVDICKPTNYRRFMAEFTGDGADDLDGITLVYAFDPKKYPDLLANRVSRNMYGGPMPGV